jgi:hypothetical protein
LGVKHSSWFYSAVRPLVLQSPDVVAQPGSEALVKRMEKHEFEPVTLGHALLQGPEWLNTVKEERLSEVKNVARRSLTELY